MISRNQNAEDAKSGSCFDHSLAGVLESGERELLSHEWVNTAEGITAMLDMENEPLLTEEIRTNLQAKMDAIVGAIEYEVMEMGDYFTQLKADIATDGKLAMHCKNINRLDVAKVVLTRYKALKEVAAAAAAAEAAEAEQAAPAPAA